MVDLYARIDAAREKWSEDIWFVRGGVTCPVCDRKTKVYKTRFSVSILGSLVWLYQHDTGGNWIHVPRKGGRKIVTSNNVGKLRKWGMAERKPNLDDPKKNCSGVYRITKRGRQFVQGRLRIPEYIYIYNDRQVPQHFLCGDEINDIKIHEVEGYFDFEEIMKEAIGSG